MKKALIAAILLLAAAVTAWLFHSRPEQGEDPGNLHLYLNDTYEMVRLGEHSAALERYIWFHEHALEHDPHMLGVRLSYSLSDWRQLADVYPPAMEAMIATRDRVAAQIRAGQGSWDLFQDLQALNEKLDDEPMTVELFKHLHATQPSFAKRVWRLASNHVIAAGEYEMARHYVGDPIQTLAHYRRSYEGRIAHSVRDEDQEFREFREKHARNHFVDQTLELMQLFSALDEEHLVNQIGTKALETLNDPRIKQAMQP